MSAIFFPLRTSVELFEDPESPEASTRVKEGAVLYDDVYVEDGLLNATFLDDREGAMVVWVPSEQVTEEDIEAASQPAPWGHEISVTVAGDPESEDPDVRDDLHLVMRGPVKRQFAVHFEDSLRELHALSPDWLKPINTGGAQEPPGQGAAAEAIGGKIRALNQDDRADRELMEGLDPDLRTFIVQAFNRDATLATALGAAFNVTSMFKPMLERRAYSANATGSDALAVKVPNLSAVPWEAVVAFREHPGSQEARAKLREFDARAMAEAPEDAYTYLASVRQQVSDAYDAALREWAPSLTSDLQLEVMKFAVSCIPVVGPAIEKAGSLGHTVHEAQRFTRSWVAALMTLKPQA
jgi:hypothetical protein